jgi:hypothetical protein
MTVTMNSRMVGSLRSSKTHLRICYNKTMAAHLEYKNHPWSQINDAFFSLLCDTYKEMIDDGYCTTIV